MSDVPSPERPTSAADPTTPPLAHKTRTLVLLATAALLALALWFSGSAVVPQLTEEWNLTGGEQSWMIADPWRRL